MKAPCRHALGTPGSAVVQPLACLRIGAQSRALRRGPAF